MSTVYVTHIPHRRDPVTQNFSPAINVSPASEHGEIVVMMPPRASYVETDYLIKRLLYALKDYDFEKGDSLLPLGDPALIASAVYVLAAKGPFNLLRFDKKIGKYTKIRVGSELLERSRS